MITLTSLQLELTDAPNAQRRALALNQLHRTEESDLILLPEIWATGFFNFDRYAREGEAMDGELVSRLRETARERRCHIHMGSFVERDRDQLYNTSLLIGPGGEILAKYRKIHLFGYQSLEQQILTPGDEVVIAETDLGRLGLATCYDLRFPELFRQMSDRGVDMILVTSAWPLARVSAWTLFNRARAHENLAFLVSCNCAGANQGTAYAGNSMVVGPDGEIMAQAGKTGETLHCRIDPNQVRELRSQFPALNDRVL